MYAIYQITNNINGKIYIGAHTFKDETDTYMGSGHVLWNAYRKYGIENFTRTILSVHSSKEEMFAEEKRLVNQSFVDRTDTYNLRCGGNGGFYHINKDRSKYRDSFIAGGKLAASKHWKHGWWMLPHSEICRRANLPHVRAIAGPKIAAARKENPLVGPKNGSFGSKWFFNDELKVNKKVINTEIDNYISLGWLPGRKTEYYYNTEVTQRKV